MLLAAFQFQFTSVNTWASTSWLKYLFPSALPFPSPLAAVPLKSRPMENKWTRAVNISSHQWNARGFPIRKGHFLSLGCHELLGGACLSLFTLLSNGAYLLKFWSSVVVVSMTPLCRQRKHEARQVAVFFSPFHVSWLVDTTCCTDRLRGHFLETNKHTNKPQPHNAISKLVLANHSSYVPNCHRPHREQVWLQEEGAVVSISVLQLFLWPTVHNCMLKLGKKPLSRLVFTLCESQ